MEIDHKCAHAFCNCQKPETGEYCGSYCQEADAREAADGVPALHCGCGHADCEAVSSREE
jgi:hypothetical protein